MDTSRLRFSSHQIDEIVSFFSNYARISPLSVNKLIEIGNPKHYAKGEKFISAGDIPNRFAINLKGLFRYYYTGEDGREFTKGFFPEQTFLSSYSAMIQILPSRFNIEAMEDSQILVILYREKN